MNQIEIQKKVYYKSTLSLIMLLSIISLLSLGGILIFRNYIELVVEESYVKSATIALWISLIGGGLTYYNFVSNYRKSIKLFGIQEPNQAQAINRARLFGSTRFEFLSAIISICMLAFGFWFTVLFLIMGLLDM